MTDLPPEIEQQLASMSPGEWSAFTARVRAPDLEEQLKAAVGKHISGSRLDAVLRVANPAAFLGEDGTFDEAKVSNLITRMFGNTTNPAGGPDEAARQRQRLGIPEPTVNGQARQANAHSPEVQRQFDRLGITQKAGDN